MSESEIRSKHYVIEMEIPGESPWKGNNFYEKYDLLENAYYRLDDQSPKKIYKGDKKNGKCAICDRTVPDVSFTTTSHLLPESLGNRKYFSNEECDSCNEKYSEEFEGVLATMFSFGRVFRGIRGKAKRSKDLDGKKRLKRIPKIKISEVDEIHFDETSQTVTIMSESESVFSVVKEDSTLEIKAPIGKHQPAKGILSLLKSSWLLLSETQRLKYPEIIQALTSDNGTSKFHYFSAFFPGNGFPLVELNVYGKKDILEPVPNVIVMFTFLNYVLIWSSGKNDSNVFPPVYLPTANAKEMSCTLRRFVLPNVNYEVSANTETHYLQFDSILECSKDEIKSQVKRNKARFNYPTGKVLLRSGESKVCANMVVFRFDCECTSFEISGKEFAGKLFYENFKNFNKIRSKFNFLLPSVEIDSALNTILFFKDVIYGDEFFLICDLNENIIFRVDDIDVDFLDKNLLDKWIDICQKIKLVNAELGYDLRFPHKISNEEINELNELTQAISLGEVHKEYSSVVSIKSSLKFKEIKKVIEAILRRESIEISRQVEFHLMNRVFGPFEQLSHLKDPIFKINNIVFDHAPDYHDEEIVNFEIETLRVTERYPRWKINEATNDCVI